MAEAEEKRVTRGIVFKPGHSSTPLVGIIDEGTNVVSFSVYTTPAFKEIAVHRIKKTTITPQDGWFEQDPMAIINNVYRCCEVIILQLPSKGYRKQDIHAIGITNQRETTVAWDTVTGKPLYNAIMWNDIRTTSTVDQILAKVPEQNKNHFMNIVGLPVSPYFSALKIRWLMDNVPAVRKAASENRCKVGTIDSWIVWNLTKGSVHITDATNASRTMLMNIETLEWDATMLGAFAIPINILPEIRSCSEIYGSVSDERCVLFGMPISGIIGNQQASLLGQMCILPGQAKNTYESGCFVLSNTGNSPIISKRGLLTTVAYKLGPDTRPIYALEGAVAVAGHALEWLESKVRILPKAEDAEEYAGMVPNTGDVYFVPAFTGLYAPYWRKNARGMIIGLTQFSTKYHVVRSALEAICFQTRDIMQCMQKESGIAITKLHADGDIASNNLLMQLQADTTGVPVYRAKHMDSMAFGVALCTALAKGIELCEFDPEKKRFDNIPYDTFEPQSTDTERAHRYGRWGRAVERSTDWADPVFEAPSGGCSLT